MIGEITNQTEADINFRNHWLRVVKNLKFQKIYVFDKLPSLNNYVDACRDSPFKGAKLKKDVENELLSFIRLAGTQPLTVPCIVHVDWYENSRRRDVDNVESAIKYILDALQVAGILKNDSRKYVKQVSHNVITSKDCGAVVWLITGDNVKDF